MKAKVALRFPFVIKLLNLVSNPMEVNARANQSPCIDLIVSMAGLFSFGLIIKEKSNDAPIKPKTNLGKRSHSSFALGLSAYLPSSIFFPFDCL